MEDAKHASEATRDVNNIFECIVVEIRVRFELLYNLLLHLLLHIPLLLVSRTKSEIVFSIGRESLSSFVLRFLRVCCLFFFFRPRLLRFLLLRPAGFISSLIFSFRLGLPRNTGF